MTFNFEGDHLIGDGNKRPYAVRFTVLFREGGVTIHKENGWRIIRGKVAPPAIQLGKTWFPIGEPSEEFLRVLTERAKELWEDKYPEVEFPSGSDKSNG